MKDLTVSLEDRPGTLADLGEALGKAGINIEGMCAVAGEGRSIIHLLVTDAIAINPDTRITPPAAGSHNLRRRGVLGGGGTSVRCPAALCSGREDGAHRSSPIIAAHRRKPTSPCTVIASSPLGHPPSTPPASAIGCTWRCVRPRASSHRPSSLQESLPRGSVPVPAPRLAEGRGGNVKERRLSGTRLSWLREVMSSFRNTRVRKRGPKRPN